MPLARCRDIELYYEDQGAGDPVVLVAGLGADATAWGFQAPALRRQWSW